MSASESLPCARAMIAGGNRLSPTESRDETGGTRSVTEGL